jgi:hypothetical protein
VGRDRLQQGLEAAGNRADGCADHGGGEAGRHSAWTRS